MTEAKARAIRAVKTMSEEHCAAILAVMAVEKGRPLPPHEENSGFCERVIAILRGITPDDKLPATTLDKAVELIRSQMEGIT